MLTDASHNLIAQFRFAAPKTLQVLDQYLDDVGFVPAWSRHRYAVSGEVGQCP